MPLNHPHAEVRIGDIQGKIETGRNKEHIRRVLVRHSPRAPRRWITESTRARRKFILAFRIVETPLTCILRDELRFQQFPRVIRSSTVRGAVVHTRTRTNHCDCQSFKIGSTHR